MTGGHTPGHCVVDVAAGGEKLTFVGEAIFQVNFDHPDWQNGFEHDPEEAARVRVALLDEAAETGRPAGRPRTSRSPRSATWPGRARGVHFVPVVWDY